MIIRLQPEPVHPSAPLTRLVATLGPNSSSVEQLTALLQAGMQVRSVPGVAFVMICQSFVGNIHASGYDRLQPTWPCHLQIARFDFSYGSTVRL
jgi:hypothetical protein